MRQETIQIEQVPAVLYGEPSRRVWLFVHGRYGCKEEGAAFAGTVCPRGAQVLAVDLPEHGARKREAGFDPWHVIPELRAVMAHLGRRWDHVSLRANSIGAWFSLLALADTPPERALLVSPVLDMEKLIRSMMDRANVDASRLEREGEISTDFGETLSWRYLQYVQAHPIVKWDAATEILCAGRDNLTGRDTVDAFTRRFGCGLTVMENGEHWFHTPEQLAVLKAWEERTAGGSDMNDRAYGYCGMPCALCTRYRTEGKSRCPGCSHDGYYTEPCRVHRCVRERGLAHCGACEEFPCVRLGGMGDFSDLHTNHVKERTCRAVAAAGFPAWQREYEAKADLLTTALARYNNGRMKRYLCELFIQQDLATLETIMDRAANLSGTPKEQGKAFQEIVRDVLGSLPPLEGFAFAK